MKYTIEFDLPDNETVLKKIERTDVKWSVWGYHGYAKPKPSGEQNLETRYNLNENERERLINGLAISALLSAKRHADEQTEPLMAMLEGGEDVHEFCKNCDKSKFRMFDGERYIVCGQAEDCPSITLKKCPLGKWICENTYLIKPKTEYGHPKELVDKALEYYEQNRPKTDCLWK